MLNMTGTATWAGGLALDAVGGFEFTAGETFDIATFAADPGDFSFFSVDGISCSAVTTAVWSCGGFDFTEMFTATSLDIGVTGSGGGPSPAPEPASLTLFGSALAALGWLRRRRRISASRMPLAPPGDGRGGEQPGNSLARK
jgi:hypothetical protein